MGNVDLMALIKWLWAVLPPIMYKAWGLIDTRFKQVESDNKDVKSDLNNMKSSIEVLIERSGSQEKRQDDMSDKIDKIYDILMNIKNRD